MISIFAASEGRDAGLFLLAFGSLGAAILGCVFFKRKIADLTTRGTALEVQNRALWAIAVGLLLIALLLAPVATAACDLLYMHGQVVRLLRDLGKKEAADVPAPAPYRP